MGLTTAFKKLFSSAGDAFKKPTAKAVQSSLKGFDSGVVKTAGGLPGITNTAVSGGSQVASKAARKTMFDSTPVRIGKKAVATSALGTVALAAPAGAGIYLWDKYKDVQAGLDQQAEQLNLYAQETGAIGDRMQTLADGVAGGAEEAAAAFDRAGSALRYGGSGATAGAGSNEEGGSMLGPALLIAGLGTAGYFGYKQLKKRKGKKK